MEIGSFIGLDLSNPGEYYSQTINIARLNSARAGIYHACRLYGCDTVHIPYYLCPTVKNFLHQKEIKTIPYFIHNDFEPVLIKQENNQAVLIVNYFGILSNHKISTLAGRFCNVIIDNSAAFYSPPVNDCYTIYSPRKFFGVPDGCYVIGTDAGKYLEDYQQDYSSDTASYLLKTLEVGTNASYSDRMKNEERIDRSDILQMSFLTRKLLNNIDYSAVKTVRMENFQTAHELYKNFNLIDPGKSIDDTCVPMVYPLVIENTSLDEKLRENKVYVGRLWKSVLRELSDSSFETWLSKYMVPLPIDQRYRKEEILHVYNIILNLIGNLPK